MADGVAETSGVGGDGVLARDTRGCHSTSTGGVLTIRSLAVGLIVGTLMCFTNCYFGLQTGWITMGSLQSAILGFGIFKLMQMCGYGCNFTVAENVIVQTTSVATATMPLAAGFVGVIPAMSQLTEAENPPLGAYVFTTPQLILWSLTLAFFGIFVAVPLRTQVIEREQLKFPSGTATAHVIRALHAGDTEVAYERVRCSVAPSGAACRAARNRCRGRSLRRPRSSRFSVASLDRQLVSGSSAGDVELSQSLQGSLGMQDEEDGLPGLTSTAITLPPVAEVAEHDPESPTEAARIRSPEGAPGSVGGSEPLGGVAGMDLSEMKRTWAALGTSFGASFMVTSLASVLESAGYPSTVPLFGHAAGVYGWRLGANAGYVGQGMIMGPRVTSSMLAGTIFAFGVLAPIAVQRSWACVGELCAEEDPSSADPVGWVSWISLAIMIADSITSLVVLLVKYGVAAVLAHARGRGLGAGYKTPYRAFADEAQTSSPPSDGMQIATGETYRMSPRTSMASLGLSPFTMASSSPHPPVKPDPSASAIPALWWASGLVVSASVAMLVLANMFTMPFMEVFLATCLAMLVAVLAVRALGETDLNPVSGIGKLTQAIFAVMFPRRVLANLVAGAVSEAAAQQAGDMMQDFKAAYLLGVCPRAQFVAMVIGSAASCFVSTGAYTLYSSVYVIGGPKLPAPTAKIWIDMARLVTGGSLPPAVTSFCWAGVVFGVTLALIPESLAIVKARAAPGSRVSSAAAAVEPYLPSGIGFAIGMYVTPQFVLPRVLGSAFEQVWIHFGRQSHASSMLIVASGLVLGEGIASMVFTIIKSLTSHRV